MADFGSPVAVNVNVNPNQGIQTLSGLLGLKQQQQALQTGQALQESAKAEAVTKGIQAQAQQQASGFIQKLDIAKYHNTADGTFDPNAVMMEDEGYKNLIGPAKEIANNYLFGVKAKQIENKANMAKLNTDVLATGAKLMGALTGNKEIHNGTPAGKELIIAQAEMFKQMFPDQGAALIDPFMKGILSGHVKPEDWEKAVQSFALQVESVAAPKLLTYFTPEGNIAGATQNQVNSQITPQPGPGVAPGLGPTETIPYRAELARQTAGAAGLATGGAADITTHYTGVQGEAQRAEAFTGIARNVQNFAHQALVGTPEQKLNLMNGMLAFIGIGPSKDVKTASDLLQKNMAQLNLQGNAASDFRAMVTQMAQPHMSMSEDAIKRAAGQLIGQAQMKKSIGTALTREYDYAVATGQQDLYRQKRDTITQIADPRVWEFESMTPSERKEFRKNLSPQDDKELGMKYKAAKALGLLQQ